MYKHKQVGWLLLGVLGGAALLILVISTRSDGPAHRAMVLSICVLAVVAYLFSGLTVRVDRTSVVARFGPGLFGKTISLSDIVACKVVRNRWWYGWGIRKIPGGWLYNVSGLDAVEFTMRSGKVYRIGTDEPFSLAEAVRTRLTEPRDTPQQ